MLQYYILKRTTAESHRILVETYGKYALSKTTCRDWFRHFKSGDFDTEDRERSGNPKKFQNEEFETMLDEDPSQTQEELANSLNVDRSTVAKRLKDGRTKDGKSRS